MMLFTGLPPWDTGIVWMDMTWYSGAICGFSSMFSLAIVSLSPCSAAISSRTGATILQGPHHSAQKSTRTGLSLPSTSLAKLVSVTVTVLPAIGRSPLCLAWGAWWVNPAGGRSLPCADPSAGSRRERASRGASPLVEGLREPPFGVDRRGGTGAGRGDGLAVDVVDDVAAGEHAVDVGSRAGVLDLDVALVVELELAGEQFAARVVADGDEQAAHRHRLGAAALDVGQLDGVHGGVTEDVGDLLAELPADLLVVLGPLLHDLRGAQLGTPVDDGHALGEAGEEGGLLHRGVAAADDHDVLVAEEEAVTGRTGRHAAAEQPLLVVQAEVPVLGARRHDHDVRAEHLAADLHDLRADGQVDLRDVPRLQLGAELLGLVAHVVHELRALDALREAGEVLHLGGGHQRAAELRTLEHQRVEVGAGGVDGRGVSGRARPDDDQVTHAVVLGRRDHGVDDLARRHGGSGGRLGTRHGPHNEDRRGGIPGGTLPVPGGRYFAACTPTSAMSAENPLSLGTRPVIQTSTKRAVTGLSKVRSVLSLIVPSAACAKPSSESAGLSPVRISTVAPGVMLLTVTSDSALGLPRSSSRPTPSLRLPKFGEPRYSRVDQAVEGSPS